MNCDEQFYEKIDKSVIIYASGVYVIISTQTKIQKGQFLLPFFFIYTKIISDEGMMKE